MCGVEGKRQLCDLNVTSLSPALATRHIRSVLLVNSPNMLNLLSWLLIYLCNKYSALHQTFISEYSVGRMHDKIPCI